MQIVEMQLMADGPWPLVKVNLIFYLVRMFTINDKVKW